MSPSSRPHVAIIGAGGLGGPIAYALARAGADLTVCDPDVVELSNLQRQVHFRTADIGRPKVECLADELVRRGHARARIRAISMHFTADSAADVVDNIDLIVDGSDDFATKFEVNDQAMRAGIPYVIASVVRYTGQVFAADPRRLARDAGGCYRCLFEAPPVSGEDEGRTCADGGVLGAAVGLIGGVAAQAALTLLRAATDEAPPPARHAAQGLWVIDDVRAPEHARHIRFALRRDCPACASSLALVQKEAS